MSLFHSPSLVTSGLVLCLDAGNPKSYPGTGTTWTDLSGNGNNGTLINGPTYSSANAGSIVFDGVNDMAECSPSSLFNFGTGNFSAFLWFRQTQSSTYPTIMELDNVGNGTMVFYIDNSTFRSWVGNNVRNSTAILSTNIWNYCGVSRSSGVVSQYVNGVLDGTFTGSGAVGSGQYLRFSTAFYSMFNGRYGQTALYNRALSAAEVKQNFNALRGRYGV